MSPQVRDLNESLGAWSQSLLVHWRLQIILVLWRGLQLDDVPFFIHLFVFLFLFFFIFFPDVSFTYNDHCKKNFKDAQSSRLGVEANLCYAVVYGESILVISRMIIHIECLWMRFISSHRRWITVIPIRKLISPNYNRKNQIVRADLRTIQSPQCISTFFLRRLYNLCNAIVYV